MCSGGGAGGGGECRAIIKFDAQLLRRVVAVYTETDVTISLVTRSLFIIITAIISRCEKGFTPAFMLRSLASVTFQF